LEKTIVAHVKNILCEVLNIHKRRDPRFCIAMNLEQGWDSTINIFKMKGKEVEFVIEHM
jgi:hypothetical protein